MFTNRSCKLDITIKVEIINELRKNKSIRLSVSHLCKLFRVTRETYYKRLKRKSQVYKKQHLLKEKQIIKVFEDNNRVYGVEKLKKVLDQQGKYEISRQKIRQVMRDRGLYPVYMKRYRQKYKVLNEVVEDWRKDLGRIFDVLVKFCTSHVLCLKQGLTYLMEILRLLSLTRFGVLI